MRIPSFSRTRTIQLQQRYIISKIEVSKSLFTKSIGAKKRSEAKTQPRVVLLGIPQAMKIVLHPFNTTGSVAVQVFNFNFKYLLCDTFRSEKKPQEVPINRIKKQSKTQHKPMRTVFCIHKLSAE